MNKTFMILFFLMLMPLMAQADDISTAADNTAKQGTIAEEQAPAPGQITPYWQEDNGEPAFGPDGEEANM